MIVEDERLLLSEWCYTSVLSQPPPQDGKLYCAPLWDTWGCWNYTLAGSTAFIQCPGHHTGFDPTLTAHRTCTEDGTWWLHPRTNQTWANYTLCINQDDLRKDVRQTYFFIGGYSVSIALLLAALLIFSCFRQLQCDRVTIHKHLFVSYILNGIVWILYYSIVSLDVNIQTRNPVWCQVLHVVTQYFVQCNFYWMFCEGFYLHTIIVVVTFTASNKLLYVCYVIGWGLPVVFTVIYAAIRASRPLESLMCWVHDSHLLWIPATPIVLSILTNLFFLLNILKVLLTKLRSVQNPDTNSYRKAARAILILIPLLGLQFILFPIKFSESGLLHELYLYAVAFVVSFQGTFVSLIFCFFNGEVHTVIKRRWGQHRLMSRKVRNPRCTYLTTMTEQQPPPSPPPPGSQTAPRQDQQYYSLEESKAPYKMDDTNHNV